MAIIMVWTTLDMDSIMVSLESFTTVMLIPGFASCSLSISLRTCFDTSMAVELCCFLIPRDMMSWPL